MYPLAPATIASTTRLCSLRVSTSTREAGAISPSCLIASTPDMPGSLRSISTTSGRRSTTISTAASPLAASPTRSRPPVASACDRALRINCSSSTKTTVAAEVSSAGIVGGLLRAIYALAVLRLAVGTLGSASTWPVLTTRSGSTWPFTPRPSGRSLRAERRSGNDHRSGYSGDNHRRRPATYVWPPGRHAPAVEANRVAGGDAAVVRRREQPVLRGRPLPVRAGRCAVRRGRGAGRRADAVGPRSALCARRGDHDRCAWRLRRRAGLCPRGRGDRGQGEEPRVRRSEPGRRRHGGARWLRRRLPGQRHLCAAGRRRIRGPRGYPCEVQRAGWARGSARVAGDGRARCTRRSRTLQPLPVRIDLLDPSHRPDGGARHRSRPLGRLGLGTWSARLPGAGPAPHGPEHACPREVTATIQPAGRVVPLRERPDRRR